ncbi:MAG: hypothetical protein AB7S69_01345 [Salinivirgaceae bacterium]
MENSKTNQKSLVCITSCNRLSDVKKYIWDYINFCNKNEGFDFLLALDGNNEDYIQFCNAYEIPLLYSEEREGVGLSKNRVITKFPNYNYYFFIEDDIELLDSSIFALHIDVSKETGYPHFISSGIQHIIGSFHTVNNKKIIKAEFGGGTFNFFTKAGLIQAGGWHTVFAKHKRYGHTEHTYRFYNAGLQPAPFLLIEETQKMTLIHPAPHVTQPQKRDVDDRFIKDEGELFHKKLEHYPVKTLSPYFFNGFDKNYNDTAAKFLQKKQNRRYPLLKGIKRRKALAEYYFLHLGFCNSFRCRLRIISITFFYYPLYRNLIDFFTVRIKSYTTRIYSFFSKKLIYDQK